MKITILGCGSSSAVPLIGCNCAVCSSDNPKNRRLRVSVLIETGKKGKEGGGKILLIDSSPDLRQQCLDNGITSVDAILYTHAHADHTHGIDDIRSLNYHKNAPLPCYADKTTLNALQTRFSYAFKEPVPEFGWFRPCLIPNEITAYEPFKIAADTDNVDTESDAENNADDAEDIEIIPFTQIHGKMLSMGFRIGDFAYSTDANALPEESFAALKGVKLWVVDCLRYEEAPTHAHLELTLQWIERVQPQRAILTHLSHDFDYETLKRALPANVEPGFDGMQLSLCAV